MLQSIGEIQALDIGSGTIAATPEQFRYLSTEAAASNSK